MTVRGARVSTEPGVQTGRINTPLLRQCLAGVGGLALAACAARTPAPAGLPTNPAPTTAVVAAPTVREWSITAPATDARFVLRSDAVIVARADTLVRTDSASTITALRVTPRGAAFDIALDSHVVRVAAAQPLRIGSGVRAIARVNTVGGWEFIGPDLDPCTGPTRAAFDATRDLWVQWPARLRVTSRWADTTAIELCREGIPLRAQLVRQFAVAQVPERVGAPLVVQRRTNLTLMGRGALRGDSTTINGEGTSDAMLYLRPELGWVDSARVTGVLRLMVRGTERTQQVEQRSQSSVRRAPDLP